MIRKVLAVALLWACVGCAAGPAAKGSPPCGVPEPSRVPQIGAKVGRGGCEIRRTRTGRIYRSSTLLREFKRVTGYPHGRPGYQIDHIVALKRGGCDCLENLQWLSDADKARKDGLE